MCEYVNFDPGIGQFVLDFNNFINNFYADLMSFKSFNQKRARFKLYVSKINYYINNNIAFYLGCLLWAYYIYNENIDFPKKISNNPFLNLTDEQKNSYDFMFQVNFMENYFDSFERDSLYYTGNKVQIPQKWKDILSVYSEFLQLNKGFISTAYTSDIILPERLKIVKSIEDVNRIIQKSIKQKDLTVLFNINKTALKT